MDADSTAVLQFMQKLEEKQNEFLRGVGCITPTALRELHDFMTENVAQATTAAQDGDAEIAAQRDSMLVILAFVELQIDTQRRLREIEEAHVQRVSPELQAEYREYQAKRGF